VSEPNKKGFGFIRIDQQTDNKFDILIGYD